jgi:hypothetical protein
MNPQQWRNSWSFGEICTWEDEITVEPCEAKIKEKLK